MARVLGAHFRWADRQVECRTARAYLPAMACGRLSVRIPTPLTVHLDHCEACRADLEAISDLDPGFEGAVRLTEMLNVRQASRKRTCEAAAGAVAAAAAGRLSEIPPEILGHMRTCRVCRQAVYDSRQALIDGLDRHGGKTHGRTPDPRNCISGGQVFDLATMWPGGCQTDAATLDHVRQCAGCLGRIQAAHRTVSGFLEPRESVVATRFHLVGDEERRSDPRSTADYFGYPIRVGVARVGARFGHLSRRMLVRAGAAVAAVLAIAGGLVLLSLNTAHAVSLKALYGAIGEIRNVYIAGFEAGHDRAFQEQWVSRELGVQLLKTGDEWMLWDSTAGARTWRTGPDGPIASQVVDGEMAQEMKASIEGSLGLVPFEQFTDVPDGAVWRRLGGDGGHEVYELSWSRQVAPAVTVLFKWRLYVDTASLMPVRVESYRKRPHDADFVPATVVTARPLTSVELRDALSRSGLWKGQ